MTRLRICQGCARHVFATEPSCPFCKAQLSAAPELAQLTVPSGASRAQRLALAAAISSTTLLGCAQTDSDSSPVEVADNTAGRSAPNPGDPSDGQAVTPGGGIATPVYGAPVPGNPGQPAQAGRGSIDIPIYGAPVAGSPAADEDAGVPEAGASAAGSGGAPQGAAGSGGSAPQAGAVAVPVYGAPIPEYGAPPPPED